jgi:(p)ppGpp synthase/HD superfamily hydrolase
MSKPLFLLAAEDVARTIHAGQERRDGKPYITHIEAVVAMVEHHADPHLTAVAWLHDVIEDGGVNGAQALTNKVFGLRIPDAVRALTKVEGEAYDAYLKRVADNRMAVIVKVADMIHNLSDSPKDETRKRYAAGLKYLLFEGPRRFKV